MVNVDYDICDSCCTCISVCPADALIFLDKLNTLDEKCIRCTKCVRICPVGALSLKEKRNV